MVEFPRLVADPQIESLLLDQIVEHHEVVEQDLIHVPPGLEDVQSVLAALAVDVLDLARQHTEAG